MDPDSLSFIRFQCILHDSGVIFSKSWNFCKLRTGDLISRGTQFCKNSYVCHPLLHFNFKSSKYLISSSFIRWMQKVWIIWSPLLYSNFKSFMDKNSSSFIRTQCILHDWGVLFSESWNFYKLKRGDLISGGNQFCRKSELFGRPFFISILKVLCTQIHHHSLDLNLFCMIEEYFSQSLEISTS